MKKSLLLVLLFFCNFLLLDAQLWSPVGKGIYGAYGEPLAEYNNILWVGGNFDSAGGFPSRNIAKWNNNTWIPVANGFDWGTFCGTVYNGKLYVGGEYDSVSGKPIRLIAGWNGVKWDSVGVLGLAGNGVFSLDTFKGKL